MEHDRLAPLMAPLTSLRGVGDAIAKLLARAADGERIGELLFHLPEGHIDRRARTRLVDAAAGEVTTVEVEVVRIEPPGNPRQPHKVIVSDGSGFAELVFFRALPRDRLPVGARVLVSGRWRTRSTWSRSAGRASFRRSSRCGR